MVSAIPLSISMFLGLSTRRSSAGSRESGGGARRQPRASPAAVTPSSSHGSDREFPGVSLSVPRSGDRDLSRVPSRRCRSQAFARRRPRTSPRRPQGGRSDSRHPSCRVVKTASVVSVNFSTAAINHHLTRKTGMTLMTRRSYRCRCRRRLLHHSVGCTSDLGLRLERQAWDCIDCYRDSGVQWRCTHVCGILTLVVQVTVGFLRHSSFTGNGVF